MRKGQKKKKDVLTIKDVGQVAFWQGEESPCFNEENHGIIDQCFTRDPQLKNVLIHKRQLLHTGTSVLYTSYELTMEFPPEPMEFFPVEIPTDPNEDVASGDEPRAIPTDRKISEPIMGQTENDA